MLRICPLSPEDRERILHYCEGHKAHVINERDIDNCVVIDVDKDTPQGIALLTGLKTNALAKFKTLKENTVSILKELIELYEGLAQVEVEKMSVSDILSAADLCSTCDDLTPFIKGEDVLIDEVTETSGGDPVVIMTSWYQGSKYIANITFNGTEVASCDVEKDVGGRKHFQR